MTKSNILKSMLAVIFSNFFENVFFFQGYKGFPRLIFDFKRTSSENGIDGYILTVDVFGMHTTQDIDDKIDKLENYINQSTFTNDNTGHVLEIYTVNSERLNIIDEDKDIRHIQIKYNMTFY